MPLAELIENEIVVEASYREKAMMPTIPGAKWKMARDRWILPLSMASCHALRGSFPKTLEIGPALLAWGQYQMAEYLNRNAVIGSHHNEEYGYQIGGWKFMLGSNVLLADEMGLGKSKQIIDMITHTQGFDSGSILIVCPNSLKYTWKKEWEKWAPAWNVTVLEGTLPKKRAALDKGDGIFIVNWESLRTLSRVSGYGSIALSDADKTPGPLNRKWKLVVADEAHRAKDWKSKQTRALWAIGETAQQRVALTGTPIANSPLDLWSIMHFVEPLSYPSRSKFQDRYCITSYNFFGGMDSITLNPHTEEEFFKILKPHFLRRTKKEVLKSLPEKLPPQVRRVEMKPKQMKAYKELSRDMLTQLETGVLFTTNPLTQGGLLNQIASALPTLSEDGKVIGFENPSCKVDEVLEILDEAPGDSLVVFAYHRGIIDLLVSTLRDKDVSVVRYNGEDSLADRALAEEKFQSGEAQVIVLSTAVGGVGLTLTRANRCVFLQHPWSNVEFTQAQDRIHRIGQTRAVQIISLIAADTIEEHILDVLADKEANLQEVCKDPDWVKKVLTI